MKDTPTFELEKHSCNRCTEFPETCISCGKQTKAYVIMSKEQYNYIGWCCSKKCYYFFILKITQ